MEVTKGAGEANNGQGKLNKVGRYSMPSRDLHHKRTIQRQGSDFQAGKLRPRNSDREWTRQRTLTYLVSVAEVGSLPLTCGD